MAHSHILEHLYCEDFRTLVMDTDSLGIYIDEYSTCVNDDKIVMNQDLQLVQRSFFYHNTPVFQDVLHDAMHLTHEYLLHQC